MAGRSTLGDGPEPPFPRCPLRDNQPVVKTDFILIAGLLVLGSLALTLMAGRIRMPALVVFIGVGW